MFFLLILHRWIFNWQISFLFNFIDLMQCSKTLSVISSTDWESAIRALKLHQYFEFGPASQDPFSFCQIQLALDTVYSYIHWNQVFFILHKQALMHIAHSIQKHLGYNLFLSYASSHNINNNVISQFDFEIFLCNWKTQLICERFHQLQHFSTYYNSNLNDSFLW